MLASCVLEGRKARFYVTNDRPEDFARGAGLPAGRRPGPGAAHGAPRRNLSVLSALEVGLMDFTGDFDPAARHPEDDRMVYFTLLDGEGQAVSEGCELFSLPKHFAFQPPRIRWEIAQEADGFRITLDCDGRGLGRVPGAEPGGRPLLRQLVCPAARPAPRRVPAQGRPFRAPVPGPGTAPAHRAQRL